MKLAQSSARKVILAALCSAALIGGVSAADKDAPKDKPKGPPPPVAGAVATLAITITETVIIATGWRATKFIKSNVFNDKNEKIGEIDDLIVAPDNTVSFAIIEVGGFLGVAERRVAVNVKRFSTIAPPKVILPGASKDELKKLPEFKYAK